jgi:hypothetical protein
VSPVLNGSGASGGESRVCPETLRCHVIAIAF